MNQTAEYIVPDLAPDHFVIRDGVEFAGSHLIIDLWDATNLDDEVAIERVLRQAAEEAGATILHCHLHKFGPEEGVSGVLVLAESHISIHTWPERGYAALDVFMCGAAVPEKCIPVLKAAFQPQRTEVQDLRRGVVVPA